MHYWKKNTTIKLTILSGWNEKCLLTLYDHNPGHIVHLSDHSGNIYILYIYKKRICLHFHTKVSQHLIIVTNTSLCWQQLQKISSQQHATIIYSILGQWYLWQHQIMCKMLALSALLANSNAKANAIFSAVVTQLETLAPLTPLR